MRRAMIVGFTGRTSFALAKYLLTVKKYTVAVSDSVDTAEKRELLAELSLLGEVKNLLGLQNPELIGLFSPDILFVSPGVPPSIPLLQEVAAKNIPITNDIDYFASEFPGRTIAAITGTDGKTTAATWLHHVLAPHRPSLLGGNVGTPVFAFASPAFGEHIHVLELSSFQLEYARAFHAKAGVILNIAPDHLDRYPGVEEYALAKSGVFRNMEASDLALLNGDDAFTPRYVEGLKARVELFSAKDEKASWSCRGGLITRKGKPFFNCGRLKVLGAHQRQNAMAVAALALFLGLDAPNIERGLESFEGVEHRLEYLGEKNGVKFYNDSKATSPQALQMALSAFPQKIILLAGGKSKGVPFAPLRPLVEERTKAVFAFGDLCGELASVWNTPPAKPRSLEEAFAAAVQCASAGDIIVLSPGGTSYDAFRNFEERGDLFKQLFASL